MREASYLAPFTDASRPMFTLGLATTVLLTVLAVLNATLSLLATVAVWKTYLVIGTKVLLTVLVCIPVVGLLVYLFWGQRRVREAR